MPIMGTAKKNFYPRPPRGGRRCQAAARVTILWISIHALREEGDRCSPMIATRGGKPFLSTPSARRATEQRYVQNVEGCISIHALREEGDCRVPIMGTAKKNFYPRPPRGGRRCQAAARVTILWISIHALREEGDRCSPMIATRGGKPFLSTPSARRATREWQENMSSTAYHFYPRPPRGGRPFSFPPAPTVEAFLSTPSARRATQRNAQPGAY